MRKIILGIFLFISFDASAQEEVCASTFQSFWLIEPATKVLRLKTFYRHPETQLCERSITGSPNAVVQLLDGSNNPIRQFSTYLPIKLFQDSQLNGQKIGSIETPNKQTLQIKFADDVSFKKVKFIKIIFADGSTYGPASL